MKYYWDKVERAYDLYEDGYHVGTLYTENDEWRYITLRGDLGEWELLTVREKIDWLKLEEYFADDESTANPEST